MTDLPLPRQILKELEKMLSQPAAPATPGPVPVDPQEQKPATKTKQKRLSKKKVIAKPAKTLPNWRVPVARQFDILRAFAAASNNGTRTVTLEEAAKITGNAPTTVIAAVPFLLSVGFLKRSEGGGGYQPSTEAINYVAAFEWEPQTASYKAAPKLRESWFGEALLPSLSYGQAMEERAALTLLAQASGASTEYEKELKMILEFLATGGVIQREGGQIKQLRLGAQPDSPTAQPKQPEHESPQHPPTRSGRTSTSFLSQSPGGVDFNITVHVDMAEFGGWNPERIQAFFTGIAKVLAAKSGIETEGMG